jgi:hypothetical protein
MNVVSQWGVLSVILLADKLNCLSYSLPVHTGKRSCQMSQPCVNIALKIKKKKKRHQSTTQITLTRKAPLCYFLFYFVILFFGRTGV